MKLGCEMRVWVPAFAGMTGGVAEVQGRRGVGGGA